MSKSVPLQQAPHRTAESIKETIRYVESLVILCENAIRYHSIPEMQNTANVLESLFQPLYEAGNAAESLEKVLFRDYETNGNKPSFDCEVVEDGGAS